MAEYISSIDFANNSIKHFKEILLTNIPKGVIINYEIPNKIHKCHFISILVVVINAFKI